MTEWRPVTIGDLGQIVTGSTPPKKQAGWFGCDVDFITPGDLSLDGRRPSPSRWLSAEGVASLRTRLLPPGTVCFTCIASIGKMCLTAAPAITNQQINSVIVDAEVADERFVYYLLRNESARIGALASGAATPIINKTTFSSIEVSLPSLSTQRAIACVLGAIDDLIENHRRRIEVLAQMAQTIYREWFVRFRYPGHESATFVDSTLGPMPRGWEALALGDVADVAWGDTKLTKRAYVNEGFSAYSAAGLDGLLDHYDFDRTGIVLSAIGTVGRTWLAQGRWSCIKNTIRFWSTDDRAPDEYLYLATADPSFWPRRGAAQPFIALTDARTTSVVVPSEAVGQQFGAAVRPLFENIFYYRAAMGNLTSTRDHLLPRLVTGEVDVSGLGLDAHSGTGS